MGQQQRRSGRRFVVHKKTSTSMQRPKVLSVGRAGWGSWHESVGGVRNVHGVGSVTRVESRRDGEGEARQAGDGTPAW